MRRPCSITLLVRKEALPLLPKTPNTYCQERAGIAAVQSFAASCGQIWRVRKYRGSADYTSPFREKTALVHEDGRFHIDSS
jgi:hypothetical protein